MKLKRKEKNAKNTQNFIFTKRRERDETEGAEPDYEDVLNEKKNTLEIKNQIYLEVKNTATSHSVKK